MSLRGARFDDLFLNNYHTEVAKSSPLIELLRPVGVADAYFAETGWLGANLPGCRPTPCGGWRPASTLSPGHPVVLTFAPGRPHLHAQDRRRREGDVHHQRHRGQHHRAPVTLTPYGSIKRIGLPEGLGKSNIVHEGAIGVLGLDSPDLQPDHLQGLEEEGRASTGSRRAAGWASPTNTG